jgi:S-DNA-T family DNA segregation ATPase FtsK/SpoIIIE
MQAALNVKGINGLVSHQFDGPQIQTYRVDLAVGEQPERVERFSGAMAIAAGVNQCRVSRSQGRLLVEIAKPPGKRKVLPVDVLMERARSEPSSDSSWRVPIGIDTLGNSVWLDLLDERTCHAVLGGTTGSGKTNLLHWILFQLMIHNPAGRLQLLLMDPKGYELNAFSHTRHLIHPPAHRTDEIVKLLLWVQDKMADRSKKHTTTPRILVVIDEVRELAEQDRRVQTILASIAQIGRGVGIHLLASTQQPGAKSLGEAVVNFPARLLGRVASATLTYGAAGRARSQANVLLGRGDFLFLTQDHNQRFQAPLMEPELLDRLPKTDQISELELGEAIDIGPVLAQDNRGGHNRKSLDLEQVRRLVLEEGYSAGQLNHELGIYYERAQRLVSIVHAVAQGADASHVSYRFDIPYARAQRLVATFGGKNGH